LAADCPILYVITIGYLAILKYHDSNVRPLTVFFA
jgi:hypothetical protein